MKNSTIRIDFLVEDPAIQSIVLDYWQLNEDGNFENKVSPIAKAHELSIHQLSDLMRASAKVTHLREICRGCQDFRSLERRSEYKKLVQGSIRQYLCPECHQKQLQKWRAEGEERERARQVTERARQVRISDYLQSQAVPFSYSSLPYKDAIYFLELIAFIGVNGEFDPLRVPAISSLPSESWRAKSAIIDLYRHLYDKGLLQFSLENPYDYFKEFEYIYFDDARFNDVLWMLAPNLDRDDEYISEHELLARAFAIDEKDLCSLWEDLVIVELQGIYAHWYGFYEFEGDGINNEVGIKIHNALLTLSPGEVTHLIQYSIREVAATPGDPPIRTRSNEVVRRRILNAFTNCVRRWPTWEHAIYPYDRRHNTAFSNYVLNFYFGGDEGWKKLNLTNIAEYAAQLCWSWRESGLEDRS